MIQKRSVLYFKDDKGQFRFSGWAVTTTTLGAMMEPFNIDDHHVGSQDIVDFDPSDPMVRIDELQSVDPLKECIGLSHGETMEIHGGNLMPRVLIKTGNF